MVVKGMKFKLKHLTLMSAIALTATTAGLSVPAAVKSQSPSTIKIDGSSTVFPITEAAEDFQQQRRGAATVGVSGTGAVSKVLPWRDGHL